MKSFLHFLRKTWFLFLLLFLAPIIVVIGFYIFEYVLHKIDMSAGEWSALLGSVFGYWGTVLLGVLAFYQNEKVQENNDILTQYERRRMSPVFAVEVEKYDPGIKNLILQIKNISENLACNILIDPLEKYKDDVNNINEKAICKVKNKDDVDYLGARDSLSVEFETPIISIEKGQKVYYHLSITATDIIGLSKKTLVYISIDDELNISYSYKVIDI